MNKLSKTLIITTLTTTIASCSYNDRQVTIDPIPNHFEVEEGNYNDYNIVALDGRKNRAIIAIGNKVFGKEVVEISSNQNIPAIIKEELIKGFTEQDVTFGKNKLLKISLQYLNYDAKRGIIIGKSGTAISVKVTVQERVGKGRIYTKYQKTYSLETDRFHFIAPAHKKDERNINEAIAQVILRILDDRNLIDNHLS